MLHLMRELSPQVTDGEKIEDFAVNFIAFYNA